jgi:hypothetical protein
MVPRNDPRDTMLERQHGACHETATLAKLASRT